LEFVSLSLKRLAESYATADIADKQKAFCVAEAELRSSA
jgi:hypothetical protein